MRVISVARLVLFSGLLGGVVVSFSFSPAATPLQQIERNLARKHQQRALMVPTRSVADSEFVATYARPLFSPSRRPFVARAVEPTEIQELEGEDEKAEPRSRPRNLRLLGINLFGGELTILVRNQETDEVRWLRKGDEFAGWILSGANADSARFACPDQAAEDCSYEVRLYGAEQASQIAE